MKAEKLKRLLDPFPAHDIEWRVASAGKTNRGLWVKVLAYITARAGQERLDEVFGQLGWQTEYRFGTYHDGDKLKEGVICRLGVQDGTWWVWKEDGAQCTDFEPWKGGISDAFKRVCASGLGIGRYLYFLSETFAMCSEDKKAGYRYGKTYDRKSKEWISFWWDVPSEALPEWALPGGEGKPPVSPIESGEWK